MRAISLLPATLILVASIAHAFPERPARIVLGFAPGGAPDFRVKMEGGPVFILDVESDKVNRLGFFTTRWVRGSDAKEAGLNPGTGAGFTFFPSEANNAS